MWKIATNQNKFILNTDRIYLRYAHVVFGVCVCFSNEEGEK